MGINMCKKRWLWIVGAELVIMIVLAAVLGLPGVNENFHAMDFVYQQGENVDGLAVAGSDGAQSGWFISTPQIKLGYGVYRVEVEYESTSQESFLYFVSVSEQSTQIKNIGQYAAGTEYFKTDRNKLSTQVFVNRGDVYYAGCIYGGDGELAVRSISIKKEPGGVLKGCLIYILAAAVVDLLILFADRRKRGLVGDESIRVFFALGLTVIFASFPLGTVFLVNGHDMGFHLARIDSIKNGILSGEFPIKLYSDWLCGNGYASGVFYGDALLYIPALFRIAGFNLMQSYKIFVLLCNLATCVISYYCFKGMSGSRKTAVIGAALYTASIYRLIDIYVRASVGEYTAMIFLPVIAYGMYRVYADDVDSVGFKKNWIIPVIGFSGIINSHILTCEMTGMFTVLLCLIMFRKTFAKKRFILLVKIVVYTLIVNIGFILPFVQYFVRGGIVATDTDRFFTGIQQYGAFLAQIFEPVTTYAGLSTYIDWAIRESMPVNVGAGLALGGVVLLYVLIMGYVKKKGERTAAWLTLAFAALAIWMSTSSFPWNMLKKSGSVMSSLVSSIQYPWRFLSIASMMLVVGFILALKAVEDKKRLYMCAGAVVLAVNIWQGAVLMSNILNNAEPYLIYQGSEIDTTQAVTGAEYLPADTLVQVYSAQYVLPDDGISCEVSCRDNNYVECHITNSTNIDGRIIFSMVYYDGYTAVDAVTGEKLEVYMDGGRVAVNVSGGYSGDVIVKFSGFVSWKIAGVVSIIGFLMLMAEFIKYRTKAYEKWRHEWIKRRG